MAERPYSAWIVDDDASMRWVFERALAEADIRCQVFDSAAAARAAFSLDAPDVVVSDLRMPGEDGLQLLAYIAERHPELPVIISTAHSDLDAALSAYAGGAFDYLPKPFDVDTAVALVRRAAAHHRSGAEAPAAPTEAPDIIGEAPAMQQLFRAIGRLKRSDISMLLTGETGTGKELVARTLHRHSSRTAKPFVALNAAAVPSELVESELFGHERGAFTGAHAQRVGRFEQAHGGTLFLDEVGDMPAAAQTRLLRVLAEGEFFRVGGSRPVCVDVRVIAATHQPLQVLVDEGRFRADLYHRLNVVHLDLPPLRERASDIPLLLRHFLHRSAQAFGTPAKRLTPEVERWLSQLPWPGNVRELENLCSRLTVMAPGAVVHVEDLPDGLRPAAAGDAGDPAGGWQRQLAVWAEHQLAHGATDIARRAAPEFERVLIEAALKHVRGNKGEAAKLLGWGRNTVGRKLKR